MNQTQIRAVDEHLTEKVRDHYRAQYEVSQKEAEKIKYPEVEALAKELHKLQLKAEAMNKKYEDAPFAYPVIENIGTSRYGSDKGAHFTFHRGNFNTDDNNPERDAVRKIKDFVLALTLGEATLADVEKFLAKLIK